MVYETVFNSIDDILREDAGCSSELDYIEQTSWILFLKYLEDYELEKEARAKLDEKPYRRLIKGEYCWSKWAAPKRKDGTLDSDNVYTDDDLLDFVNRKLFPHLANFNRIADNPRSIEYKIGEIFSELRNRLQSGYALRGVIDKVDKLKFSTRNDKHELSLLYEEKIKKMGNAGRNGGEYYTPRSLIRSIIEVIDPKIGETIYDGSVGSAGFLCEVYDWMRYREKRGGKKLGVDEYEFLQNETLQGKEKKVLAYIIGVMNMILHDIESPNIRHTNTLSQDVREIQESEKVNVVLTNPPFGSKERADIQQNFPIKSSETAYLFLGHYIKILKAGGRAGVVIKNTFLSNTDNASIALREQLLKDCNLFAILDLPSGAFVGTGVKTVVLFFKKGETTEKIWYYQLNLDRKPGKTDPLNDKDLAEFVELAKTQDEGENSWFIDIKDINQDTYDLTVKNPNRAEEIDTRTPEEIITEIQTLDKQATDSLQKIKELL